MRYLSVCSGIEAVSVAWQPLGWQPAMFAEIDPFCAWLLRSRYGASRPLHMPSPNDASNRKEAKQRAAAIRNVVALPADGAVINAGDFTKIGVEDVGTIDLLAGGTPCQSFSVAGKRAGLDDPRGNLTIEFARLAGRLRPLWLVWENVPGVLSIDDGRTFGAFLGILVQLGYGIAYRVLDAQHFGVPQRRRRVFVVGHLGDWRGPAAVLLERHSLSGYPPPRRETRKDVAPTLSARAHGGGGPGTDFDLSGGLIPSTGDTPHCLNAGGMGRQDFETETLITHALSADGFDASEDGTGRGTPMVPVAICTAHTQSNGSGFSDDVAHTLESGGAQAVAFAQNSRDEVRLHGGDGKTVGALAAQPGVKQQSYVAFSAKDYGADADSVAPTLRGMGHDRSHANGGGQVAIAFAQNQEGNVLSGDVMQSLGTNSNATGRNAPTIAFTLHGSDGTASAASSTEVAGSLRTRAPGSIENSSTTAVLQEQPVAWSGELTASTDVTGTLQRGGEGGRVDGVMTPQMAVRRLTPRECERLQGFPDDYTLVEYRGKLAADGPRYKALGNSMAVPVMHWIGKRIAAVDAILRDRRGDGESG
ncbi:DNA (cytosine-5)-methyltransferase 1 [Silvibacterium bohemicum]|uniref:Cytosine-specific methyltransferase n=1 Tax=Silvibacterium bohemicum TaxID=1577686 RepID=A0A841JNX2_9BACT|nr:DNA cytosine methyltransferase [Silvibacterium bohemicum]MBB6142973.1 DNA (cytosine-5)-methyltransferase 1 [Silvibacterium bohemicum]